MRSALPRSRPALILATLLAFGVMSPRAVQARGEVTTPTATLSPKAGRYDSEARRGERSMRAVSVVPGAPDANWTGHVLPGPNPATATRGFDCQNGSYTRIEPCYNTVTTATNSTNQTLSFTIYNDDAYLTGYALQCFVTAPVTSCNVWSDPFEVSGGSSREVIVTYTTGSTGGSGTVQLRADDLYGYDFNVWARTDVTVTPYTVTVTPDGAAIRAEPNTGGTLTFTVANSSASSQTYTLSRPCDGTVTCPTQSPSSVTVGANSSEPVTVYYSVGAGGTTGNVRLTAARSGYASDTDDGSAAVTVNSYTVAVTPDGGSSARTAPGSYVETFTVQNLGNQAATYNFTQLCAGAVANCSTPGAVAVGSGASTTVTVNYSTPSAGTGEVRLRASASGYQDDGWVTVAVSALEPPAAPQVIVSTVNSGSTIERDLCLTIAAGSDAAYECGDLRVVHALPTTRTLNKARTPTLLYNSEHAHPYPLVAAHVTLPAGAGTPDSVVATLTIGGAERGRGKWSGTDFPPGATRRVTVGFDGLNDSTNVYAYTVEVANWYGATKYPTGVANELAVVNRSASSFGAGWWLAGLERLQFLNGGGLLWVGGDGSTRKYSPAGTNVWSAPAVDRPDTLKWDATLSRYVRYLRNGLQVRFNAAGEHKETVNRLGHSTTFSYECGRLTTIGLPPASAGKAYNFLYTAACGQPQPRLQIVEAPPVGATLRRVTITSASGQLRTIKDPTDGSVTADSVMFDYHSTVFHRLRARTDRRGTTTTYGFDGGSSMTESSTGMGAGQVPIVATFQPAETKGLPGSAFPNAVDTAQVYTLFDGPRPASDVVDQTKFWLDRFGSVRKIRDALNGETTLKREDSRWPALVTEMKGPTNLVTHAWYDGQGLVDSTKVLGPYGDSRNPLTRFRWDPAWQFVTAIVPPEQDSVVFEYDPATGNRRWQQDARGASSKVEFGYHTSGVEAGLLAFIDGPLSAPQSLYYESTLGNLREMRTPMGFRTRFHADVVGRDTLVVTPFDSAQQDSVRRRSVYDLRSRVVLSQSLARFRLGSPNTDTVTASVRTTFDQEGNVVTIKRWSSPNPASIDTLIDTYTYDGANRQKTAWSPDGKVDSATYDGAGNLVTSYTRRGHVITLRHDALGRLLERRTPPDTQPERSFGGRSFPFYTNGLILPADTVRFTYDALGNMRTARNRDARIRRDYYPNGALKTDTLVTLSWNRADSTAHVYGLRYEYDLNGRRKTLWHPDQLVPVFPEFVPIKDVQYAYHGFGALKSVGAVGGFGIQIWYDLEGQVDSLDRGGAIEKHIYDGDGRLTRRVERGYAFQGRNRYNMPTDTIHDDRYRYDGRGKITGIVAMRDSVANEYAGLGRVAETFKTKPWDLDSDWYSREGFGADALGNQYYHRNDESGAAIDRYFRYQASTGRLTRTWQEGSVDSDTITYDAGGNLATLYRLLRKSTYSGTQYLTEEFTVNFYDPDGRLRVVDRRTNVDWVSNFWPRDKGGFEEYRYDPLGRRILTRVRRDSTGVLDGLTVGSAGIVERYVWDQDQLLYEIRYPGGDRATPTMLERDTATIVDSLCLSYCAGDPEAMTWKVTYSSHYGRVAYAHALGIDQPISIVRANYGQDSVRFTPFNIVPHVDGLGRYDIGTFGGGNDRYQQGWQWVQIEWPAPNTQTFHRFKPQTPEPVSWMGGLIDQQRTAGGNLYMRNRYYDPVSGRFTQEDPIGLAGGLNLYGYAGGDPINFSDPFGLCPKSAGGDGKTEEMSDCPRGSSGWWAWRDAQGEGSSFVNNAMGLWATLNNDVRAQLPENTAIGEFNLPIGPGGASGLARGMRRAVARAQGAEITWSTLGSFTRGVWEVVGDKGAGFVRWNRVLNAEGSTVRLFKDVYDQAGSFLRRDWYIR